MIKNPTWRLPGGVRWGLARQLCRPWDMDDDRSVRRGNAICHVEPAQLYPLEPPAHADHP